MSKREEVISKAERRIRDLKASALVDHLGGPLDWRDERDLLLDLLTEICQPIPMLLTCPSCGERHIDKGDFATKPHHTHACQHCGMTWRPAIVATVAVQFLPGFKDSE